MVGVLAALRVAVSSTVELALGCSPNNTFLMEVVGERCLQLQRPATMIYDPLLGPPPSQARLASSLDKAAEQLRVQLAARQEENVELEALRTSTARVWDLVLDNADGPSSLAASMSTVVELLEG
jgi:hypothetical protein